MRESSVRLKRTPLRRTSRLQARTELKRRTLLAREGRRAKRIRQEDRKEEAASHILPCVCGCGAQRGEVARAHLIRRSATDTRNLAAFNLPACAALSDWLDHTPGGVQAKRVLREMAVEKGERLTYQEFWPVGNAYGYYEWRTRSGW
ncbi:MAG TPA: hypothetical protein VD969_19760 [Symbiobacteriaceae bacterium]|nr:hypothetical protein [Symbiobacteriaceae bacterium]